MSEIIIDILDITRLDKERGKVNGTAIIEGNNDKKKGVCKNEFGFIQVLNKGCKRIVISEI